jgi:DnaJ-class molecular chaperone
MTICYNCNANGPWDVLDLSAPCPRCSGTGIERDDRRLDDWGYALECSYCGGAGIAGHVFIEETGSQSEDAS